MKNKKENKNKGLIKCDVDIIPEEIIESKIIILRGKKVILDKDLAKMYGVPTGRFNEQVKRNLKRFPEDFMFQINDLESNSLRSQFAILKKRRGQHSKYLSFAFTEQGVAMLSSVLNSDRAIKINIQIMRIFVRIRQILAGNQEIRKKIEKIDNKLLEHDSQLKMQAFLIDATIKKVNGKTNEKSNSFIGFRDRSKDKRSSK